MNNPSKLKTSSIWQTALILCAMTMVPFFSCLKAQADPRQDNLTYSQTAAQSPNQARNQALNQAQNQSSGQADNAEYISYMLQLVNTDRSQAGAPPVAEDPKLQHLAQVYADYLLKTGFFGHVDPFGRNPQDRANLFGIPNPISENLAWESSSFEGASVLIQRAEGSMMAEPKNQMNHRYNILNPRSKFMGIGVAKAGDKILMVQEFTEDQP